MSWMGSSLGSALSVTFPRFPLVTRQRRLSLFSLLLLSERAIRDFASFPPLHGCHRGQSSNVDHMLSPSFLPFILLFYFPISRPPTVHFSLRKTHIAEWRISLYSIRPLFTQLVAALPSPYTFLQICQCLYPHFLPPIRLSRPILPVWKSGRKMVAMHFRMVVRRPMGVLSLAIVVLGLWSGAETKRAPLGE